MENTDKRSHSISKRLPILILISFMILLLIAIVITFLRVEDRMKTEYRRMADGVTNLMIEALDNEKIDQYIEENYCSEEYVDIIKQYYQLRETIKTADENMYEDKKLQGKIRQLQITGEKKYNVRNYIRT